MTPDSLLDTLNRALAETPEFAGLFHRTSMPRYRYWALKKKDSGGRWDRWFAWTTERAWGPQGKTGANAGSRGFYAVEYAWHGNEARIVRAVRFARRSKAKARAYEWYQRAKKRAADTPRPRVDAAGPGLESMEGL